LRRRAKKSHSDAYSVEASLRQMRAAVQAGRYHVHPHVFDHVLDLGISPGELQGAIEKAFLEIDARHYKEPDHVFDPPGHGFVWESRYFGCRMYLKFRLEGRKPVCWLYSLHKAAF